MNSTMDLEAAQGSIPAAHIDKFAVVIDLEDVAWWGRLGKSKQNRVGGFKVVQEFLAGIRVAGEKVALVPVPLFTGI